MDASCTDHEMASSATPWSYSVDGIDCSGSEASILDASCWSSLYLGRKWHIPVLANIPVREVGRLRSNLWEQLDLPCLTGGYRLSNSYNSVIWMKAHDQLAAIHAASVLAVVDASGVGYRL